MFATLKIKIPAIEIATEVEIRNDKWHEYAVELRDFDIMEKELNKAVSKAVANAINKSGLLLDVTLLKNTIHIGGHAAVFPHCMTFNIKE